MLIVSVVAAVAAMAVAEVMVVAAVVDLLVVEESHGTIIGLKIARFCNFLKRHNGQTDGRTDPLIETRGRKNPLIKMFISIRGCVCPSVRLSITLS